MNTTGIKRRVFHTFRKFLYIPEPTRKVRTFGRYFRSTFSSCRSAGRSIAVLHDYSGSSIHASIQSLDQMGTEGEVVSVKALASSYQRLHIIFDMIKRCNRFD